MAALITPLVSGIPAAASGTAEFYVKGTGTISTKVFTNAIGSTQAGSQSALDAYGSVVRYCTEPVDVVVKAVGGATVKTFTFQDDARVVGLESAGFNGSLSGGGTGAGGFTTEHLAWAELYESVGGLDARVNSGSGNVDIKVAAPGGTAVFDVGNYGAVGDGTTDDRAALQAAISACALAGGGVLRLAPKTYRINGALTGFQDMLVLGQGATIRQHSMGITGWLTVSPRTTFLGVKFVGSSVTNGTMIVIGSSDGLTRPTFINCTFDGTGFGGIILNAALGACRLDSCNLKVTGGFGISAGTNTTLLDASTVQLTGCRVRVEGGIPFIGDAVYLENCDVAVTVATTLFRPSSHPSYPGRCSMVGGRIHCTHASGIVYGNDMVLTALAISGTAITTAGNGTFVLAAYQTYLYDGGCQLMAQSGGITLGGPIDNTALFDVSTIHHAAGASFSVTRRGRTFANNAIASPFVPDIASYAHFFITQTSGSTLTINQPSPGPYMRDTDFVLVFRNAAGGTVAITFDASAGGFNTTLAAGSPINVTANQYAIFKFSFNPGVTLGPGTRRWILTGFVNGMAL